MQADLDPIRPASIEWQDEHLFASDFGDGYFSRDGGLEESRAVFLQGCRLGPRFESLPANSQFVIGETGFGTGLNLLLAAELFGRRAPDSARLALVSAELHPLGRTDLERALTALPLPKRWAETLLAQYPALTPGFHRLRLADNIDLTLMFGDAAEMWRRQPTGVDAWFLDGFAPDRNPAMWSPDLFTILARRSRTGAALATFTVAGRVRQALADAGFTVQRKPGFGHKRHRLQGEFQGMWRARKIRRGRATVIGAGLAGSTNARALAERGWHVQVLESTGVASGGSGNRAGVVYTTPSGSATPQNRFYQSSYLYALRRLAEFRLAPETARFDGVVQHIVNRRQQRRADSALASGHWPASELVRQNDDSLLLVRAGFLRPGRWCETLLDHPRISIRRKEVDGIGGDASLSPKNNEMPDSDAVIQCTAGPLAGLPPLPLRPIRGQLTECRATPQSLRWIRPHCHTGYLIPAVDGIHCFGSTFAPEQTDLHVRPEDDLENLAQLERNLHQHWRELGGPNIEITGRRAALRWQARDFMPLVGPVPGWQNRLGAILMVNLGHGSRGISGTPLCAELLADMLSGLPLPTDSIIVQALDPGRFDDNSAS